MTAARVLTLRERETLQELDSAVPRSERPVRRRDVSTEPYASLRVFVAELLRDGVGKGMIALELDIAASGGVWPRNKEKLS